MERQYQTDLIDRILSSQTRRPLMVLPTGGGKTRVASGVVERWPGPALFVADRQELCDQAFEALGPGTGLLIGPHRVEAAPGRPTVVGVHTVSRRDVRIDASLVIMDEAHLAMAATFRKVMNWYPDAKIIGLTATPYRLTGGSLAEIFDEVIAGPSVRDLIAEGYLADVTVWARKEDIARAARIRAGEFDASDINALMMGSVLREGTRWWRQLAGGKRTLVFACNKAHAHALGEELGFETILEDTPKERRRSARARLRAGEIQGLVSVDALGIGFDCPEAECGLMMRPTMSRNIFRQQAGRIMRGGRLSGNPEKTMAYLIDCAGNVGRHGLPTVPDVTTLEAGIPAVPKGSKLLTIVNCQSCLRVYESTLPACPGCGAVHVQKKRIIRTVAGVLDEVRGVEETGAQMFGRTATAEARRQWCLKRRAMGWPTKRIYAVYKGMFGEFPPPETWRK